ncbi:MAG TPA: glycerol-3-phosphate dehydrogenase/oxidase [bacterium]|nr:glycerol-3-phosphate dehydrogenase/oxidase [bacterium]HPN44897.1 glycerol-3-phosphate dehydrogenase/oxidase [bacterium]
MKRNLQNLQDKQYDLLIIGGGMYGSALAWEAVSRGLKVALVEKTDFAAETSGNSLKIIHGGLRYLQTMDIMRTIESIRERKTMLKIAPHLIHPLPCIMPTYGLTMKSKHVMFAGLLLNDIISCARNFGNDPQKRIGNGRVISRRACAVEIPVLMDSNYTGAAVWYDAQAYNTERLALSFILAAANNGADVFNYMKAISFLKNESCVCGARVRDVLTGGEYEIRAKMVVTTAGPWTNKITGLVDSGVAPQKFILSKAMNIVLKRKITTKYAIGISSNIEFRDGKQYRRKKRRLLFVTPWRDYTIIGTSHLPYNGDADSFKVKESDVQDLLAELNMLMPELHLQRSDVTCIHGGVLPLAKEPTPGDDVQLLPHYRIVDYTKTSQLEGLLSVVGVKYTTARDVAEKTMNLVMSKLHNDTRLFSTRQKPLPGGDMGDYRSFIADSLNANRDILPEAVLTRLLYNYGTLYKQVIACIKEQPELAQPLAKDSAVIKAEVVHAVREEGALKLADVVLRRTDLGSGECPADDCLQACADLMAGELGWNRERINIEINQVKEKYKPV